MNYFSSPGIPREIRTGKSTIPKSIIPADVMFSLIEKATGYTKEQLGSKDRTSHITCVRHITATFLVEFCNLGLVRAGKAINRDHTTVINSQKVVESLLYSNDVQMETNHKSIIKEIIQHGRNSEI